MKKGTGLYKRKNSPYYWAWVRLSGKNNVFSTETTDKKEARDICYEKFKILKKGLPLDTRINQSKTIDDIISVYLKFYKGSPKKNYANTKSILNQVASVLGSIRNLENKHIIDYVIKRRQQKIADGSIKLELAYLRAAMRYSSDNTEKISKIFRLDGVKKLVPNENQHLFTHQQYLQFIKVCPDWLKLMIQIAYVYPVRAKELRDLEWHQVDIDKKIIRLEKTKNRGFRNLSLPDELFQAVKTYYDEHCNNGTKYVFSLSGDHIGKQNFYKHYNNYLRKAGLTGKPKLTYHRLRATACVDLDRAGVPIRTIMAIGGWKQISTVQRYLGMAQQSDLETAGLKIAGYKSI